MNTMPPWRPRRLPRSYPQGKLNLDDEGELGLTISHYRNTIRIDFGKPVSWFAMPAEQAKGLGEMLIKYAKEQER